MKLYFIVFAIGLLLGIYLSFMYLPLLTNNNVPPVSQKSAKERKTEVAKSETGYAKSFDSLKKKSNQLEAILKDTKAALQKSKHKNQALQTEFFTLLDTRFERQEEDSTEKDSNCDSLIVTVGELMQFSTEKDSLYDKVATNLEDQLKNKDSTLATKDKQYADIKSAFTQSVAGQQALIDQNKVLKKEARKQKFKSKILSAALFIFAGVATNHLIQH